MPATIRSRTWCLTINNPVESDYKELEKLVCKYKIWQTEIGDKTHTEHIQAYLQFKEAKSFETIKKIFEKAHIEKAKGSPLDNKEYCSKDETRKPDTKVYEFGEIPKGQGHRSELDEIKDKIIKGITTETLYDEHLGTMLKYGKGLKEYKLIKDKPRNPDNPINVTYIWGEPGTGKSRKMYEMVKGKKYYAWECSTKWWDGYDGEEYILIDDFDDKRLGVDFRYMLRLLDRYPMNIEIKGGTTHMRGTNFILTSNKDPDLLFNENTAWIRRINNKIHLENKTAPSVE